RPRAMITPRLVIAQYQSPAAPFEHGTATSRSLFHADYSTHGAKSGSRHFIKAASRRALAGSCQRCPFFGSGAVELEEACSAPSTRGSGEAWLRSTPPEKARGSLAVARATQRASRMQVSYTRATHVRHIR